MSFVLNKVALLFATLVVVGIVLFCSSAAQAHANHDIPSVQAPVEAVVATIAVDERSGPAGASLKVVAADESDGSVNPRSAGSSCCGKGMSNCMAAAVAGDIWALPTAHPSTHGRPLEPNAIHGAVVDGPVRPPRALV